MADWPSDRPIGARLRDYFASELRQAELDFPRVPLRRPGSRRVARPLGLAALAAVVVAAAVLLRPWGGLLPANLGSAPLGLDGLPLSIGGEPVLRGADIDARLGAPNDPTSFLAGGYLTLHPAACASPSPMPSGGCDEDWRLEDVPSGNPTHSVRLTTVGGVATFVRTSGAPTVFRVRPAVAVIGGGLGNENRQQSLLIEAVVWRQPTKGRIPTEAMPPQGGDINMALVPDFIGVWGGPTGEVIVGYAPKELLLNPPSVVGGSPGNPPPDVPVPVYGEDLTTLVGHMVAGQGFVPLGSSPAPSAPIGIGSPSSGPSLPSDGIPLVVAGEPVLRGQSIGTQIVAATGDTSFLIGGYVVFVQADCYVPPNLPSSPLTAPCGDGWLLRDMPIVLKPSPSAPSGPPLMSYRLVVGPNVPGWTAGAMGAPVVLRVHVHDERAAACAASIRDKCERAIVVESVAWRGP